MRKKYGRRIGIGLLCASMVFGGTACGNSESDKPAVKEAVDAFAETDGEEAEETEEETVVMEKSSEESNILEELLGQNTAEEEEFTVEEEEAVATDSEEETGFKKGTIEGNVYTNTSVGVKATVPEGLTIADEETVKEFEEAAIASFDTQIISEDKKEDIANAMIYDAVITSEAGSSIQVAAEDMKQTIGIKVNADAYLESLQETTLTTYESIGCTVEFSDVDTVALGGKDFSHIVIAIDYTGVAIEQECYCLAIDDYMYYIIVTNMGDCDDAITAFFDSFEAAR